jgi:hypothetical protein
MMATTSQIHALRIDITDPPEIIQIISVATASILPAEPKPQTGYYIIDNAKYVYTEKTTGAVPGDYKNLELFLSDTKLNALLNAFGHNVAIYKALKLIASKIWSRCLAVKNTDGATSTEYTRLKELYDYYKSLVADFKDETTAGSGSYCSTKNPTIAGGNL